MAAASILFPAARAAWAADATPANAAPIPEQVVVTASRFQLLGTAETSSQGVVTQQEIQLLPAYRPAQVLETVPGLEVTSHSGEGKANQYLLRGFNLDHGTDLATFIDGMPVNEVTHAHGQGYTDLNFTIPELISGVDYTKGPYYASIGDFGSVGSDHVSYLNQIPNQASVGVGMYGYQRLFTAGSRDVGAGTMLGALELTHYDGPWTNPDDQRKVNGVLRYSGGDSSNGFSVTAMYMRDLWNASNDQPVRAIDEGLIGTYGTLDPSDGGKSQRSSLSGQYHEDIGEGHMEANAFVINNQLQLWNDFTHFLEDPVHGDQIEEHEARITAGGGVSYAISPVMGGITTEFLTGVQTRFDQMGLGLIHTEQRLPVQDPALGSPFLEEDHVTEQSYSVYGQATTHWTGWFRSVIGLREDYFEARDTGTNAGSPSASFLQPKGSLIFTPSDNYEFYISAGRGFHSDDVRGVTQAATLGVSGAPLIAKSDGAEVGMRTTPLSNLTLTVSVFAINFQSELTYDPDAGETTAGPGSRRYGAELNATYVPVEWLDLYGSIASTHARFDDATDDGTGHIGRFIPNAPTAIGSLGVYLRNLDGWSAGLEYRYLGGFPITPDDLVTGAGYSEVNLDVKYAFGSGWTVGAGVYNLLDSHGDAAEFWYADRLQGEPAAGVADRHVHPLEPVTARFTLSKLF
jgi:outer membrane receptor protein involved in Fe transport